MGILGLDFLEKHRCIITSATGELLFSDYDLCIPLRKQGSKTSSPTQPILACLHITVVGPPRSEVLAVATVPDLPRQSGTWLLSGHNIRNCPVQVARALVQPTDGKLPVCLLNPRDHPVTIYQGTNIGELEEVDGDNLQVNNVQGRGKSSHECVSADKKQLIWSVAESAADHLSTTEKTQFYDLLLSYTDIFAGNDKDIGHTSKLKHDIHTEDAKPIRQSTRRLPPHQKRQSLQIAK